MRKGFTLIEILVATSIFLIVAVGFYQTYTILFRGIAASRVVLSAATLASEQFEIARNLPYEDVGVSGSIPDGVIPRVQTFARDTALFVATTTVRNVDDPFDGTIGGTPNDTAPADYKLVQVEIGCDTCRNFEPLTFTTRVAPKNLEISSGNGALFIQVFDADGNPVQGADVHVENNEGTPILIEDVTDVNGVLQLVDIPPAVSAYEITVTKAGYSSERTYPYGDPEVPNPTKPHASVLAGQVTQISFTIDEVSSLSIASVTPTCAPVGSINFDLTGSKLLGTSPDVLKYDESHVTDASGESFIEDLEWDTYALDVTDSSYDLSGLIPLLPPTLAPGSGLDLSVVVVPTDPNTILVTVKDAATQLPVSGASVTLSGEGTQTTGRGFLIQSDWSGGPGQEFFTDPTDYFAADAGVDGDAVPGIITLRNTFGSYDTDGELESSTFDMGSLSNLYQIQWQPTDQPVETGTESAKFQIASNSEITATTTWTFLGPDGTAQTYYTQSDQSISADHFEKRYFRYKMFLSTDDTNFTPTISDVSFVFTSACVPPGQVLFNGLSLGTYTVSVTQSGYQDYTSTPFSLNTYFLSHEVSLNPE